MQVQSTKDSTAWPPAARHAKQEDDKHTSMPPANRVPLGLFLAPLSRCQMPPPTAPMPKAPPMSSRILSGHGSLPWSTPWPALCWGGCWVITGCLEETASLEWCCQGQEQKGFDWGKACCKERARRITSCWVRRNGPVWNDSRAQCDVDRALAQLQERPRETVDGQLKAL